VVPERRGARYTHHSAPDVHAAEKPGVNGRGDPPPGISAFMATLKGTDWCQPEQGHPIVQPKPRQRTFCEHNRRKDTCKQCSPASFCGHGRKKGRCKECSPASSFFCEHETRKDRCRECSPAFFCAHGRLKKSGCKQCSPASNADRCKQCGFPAHGPLKDQCKQCGAVLDGMLEEVMRLLRGIAGDRTGVTEVDLLPPTDWTDDQSVSRLRAELRRLFEGSGISLQTGESLSTWRRKPGVKLSRGARLEDCPTLSTIRERILFYYLKWMLVLKDVTTERKRPSGWARAKERERKD